MKKRVISLLMVLALSLSLTMVAFASESETKSTTLTLETNKITDVGNRHIKVKWAEVSGANGYELQIANNENFENALNKTTKKKTQLYWNFAEVPNGEKDTYYIRVKPRSTNGEWSNVIVAEYSEPTIEPKVVEKIDYFSWIPKGIDWNRLFNIDWSKFK